MKKVLSILLPIIMLFTLACDDMIYEYTDPNAPRTNVVKPVLPEMHLVNPLNVVGATISNLRTFDTATVYANGVFVSQTSGVDTNSGTQSNPVATIEKARSLCSAPKSNIIILDSATYIEKGFSFDSNFNGLYAAPGFTPTVRINSHVEKTFVVNKYQETSFITNNSFSDFNVLSLENGNWVTVFRSEASPNKGTFIILDAQGHTIKSETSFSSNAAALCAPFRLNAGNWGCCYIDSSNNAQVVIFDQDGNTVYGPFALGSQSSLYLDASSLGNNKFVVAYSDSANSEKGKFVVCTYTGSSITKDSVVTFSNNQSKYVRVAGIANNRIAIIYKDQVDSNGKVSIYNDNGTSVTSFSLGLITDTYPVGVGAIDSNRFVIAYNLSSGNGRYAIYNSDGSVAKTATAFPSSCAIREPRIVNLNNTNIVNTDTNQKTYWACSYYDPTVSGQYNGKMIILDIEGTAPTGMTNPYTFFNGSPTYPRIEALYNGNILIGYQDGSTGKYQILNTGNWTAIKCTTATTVHGITFDSANNNGLTKLIQVTSTGKLTAEYCDFKNLKNALYNSQISYPVYADASSEVIIKNTRFYDNDAALYIDCNKAQLLYSQFYRCNSTSNNYVIVFNKPALTASGILINHCDFLNNYGKGTILYTTAGGNEIIRNSILYKNENYNITDTKVNKVVINYSFCTGQLISVVKGHRFYGASPYYKDESVTTPDFNLQKVSAGDQYNSQAIGAGDDLKNCGSLDVYYEKIQ